MSQQKSEIHVYEGLWGLGKSYDIEKADGFKLKDSSGRKLGQLRYAHPISFLEIVDNFGTEKPSYHQDRSPFIMSALCQLSFFDISDYTFMGRKVETLDELEGQLESLEDSYKTYLNHLCSTGHFNAYFHLYEPTSIDAYIDYLDSQDEEWFEGKLLNYEKYTSLGRDDKADELGNFQRYLKGKLLGLSKSIKHLRFSVRYSLVH